MTLPRFILVFSLLCAACMPSAPLSTVSLLTPDGKEVVLHVEVADSLPEQTEGLMHRTSLKSDGMLFVFPSADERNFWMKDTLIPLDILFFAADGSFVSGKTMEPCTVDPCHLYPSGGAARFALETKKGFMEENGITKGWTLHAEGL